MNPDRRPIIHNHPSFYSFLPYLQPFFSFPGLIAPSSSSQLRFLDGAPGCGLIEARGANRLRKAVLARPITRRQSTLHVIVLGIHAWLTEWVLMRLGNDVQERKKHSPSFPDGLIHSCTGVDKAHAGTSARSQRRGVLTAETQANQLTQTAAPHLGLQR